MKKLLAGLLGLAAVACVIGEPQSLLAKGKPVASAPKFSIADASVDEGDGVVRLTITKSGQARSSSVVHVRTANNTAISGTDYEVVDQDVAFSKSTATVVVNIPIIGDQVHEDTETFKVNMTAGSNATIVDGQAIVTIVDDDAAIPTTQVCPDGTVIPIGDTCPSPPPPDPTPPDGWVDSPNGTDGADFVAGGFDVTTTYKSISLQAGTAGPDVVGAFRFICGAGGIGQFDPIVYPGQANVGHLHQFYGNTAITKDSTYSSLRQSGGSTCNWVGNGTTAANRSAYWMPALLDGLGNVIKPNHVQIYYKRRPVSDPKCQGFANGGEGYCVNIPNGLKFIFGYDMVTGKPPTGLTYFNCKGVGSTAGHYDTIPQTVGNCVAGGEFGAIIKGPGCWDGVHLDSPNHRDHLAYASYGTTGIYRCPSTHPYVIPGFTLQAWYSVATGDNLNNWKFSSDAMHPELPHGSTFHADFFMAWDDTVRDMWHDNCIDKLLNCSSGDMGNMKMLLGATVPTYLIGGVYKTSWTNPDRLVDDPTQ
jgi:hypothetical protein